MTCDNCNRTRETTRGGFIICTHCGIVKRKHFVSRRPVHLDSDGRSRDHHGPANSLGQLGMSGSILGTGVQLRRSYNGRKLPQRTVQKFFRLSYYYQEPSKFEGQATHLRTMVIFRRICQQLGLKKSLKDRTLYLYWKQVSRDLDITNHVLLLAVCLLQSVREERDNVPLRFSEIVSAFSSNGHRVTNKNLLRLAGELRINLAPYRRTAEDYTARIVADIRNDSIIRERLEYRFLSSEQYEMLLLKISNYFLSLLTRSDRGGVQPYPFAVSVVYLADRVLSKVLCRRPILTQRVLAQAVGSAEFTIRDHVYRFLGSLYSSCEENLINFGKKLLEMNKPQ